MGFWDFLKAKKEEAKEPEKVKAGELEAWILDKRTELEKQESIFLDNVRERINQLIQELEKELSELKKIKVEGRKAEEKIKLIVKENLGNYMNYLEKLIAGLKEARADKKIIEKINSVFRDFDKRAAASFEKSTFLIGKELANVKESIKNFFKDINRALNENKELIRKQKILFSIEPIMRRIGETKKTEEKIKKIIRDYGEHMRGLKEKLHAKEKEIEEMKKSEAFAIRKKAEEELSEKKRELEKEIYRLKELINFKALAGFFHNSKKEMGIIKGYKESFKEALQRAGGEELLNMMKEARLESSEAAKKMQEILEKKKEIISAAIEKSGIDEIEEAVREIKEEIKEAGLNVLAEEKKYKKLEQNSGELLKELKAELAEANIKIE